jgi:hypothetical protein
MEVPATLPAEQQPQVPTGQLTMANIMGNKHSSMWIKELKMLQIC